MNELIWAECILIGATAGVDPTVVRRMAKGGNVRRASRKVIVEAAAKLGLALRLPLTATEGLSSLAVNDAA